MSPDIKPVIYTAGKFRGDIEANIAIAATVALQVWTMGCACICPHMNTAPWQGVLEDRVWLEGDLAIVAKCDAVLMLENWKCSEGATRERQLAMKLGIPVLYSIEELREWMEARVLC